VAYILVQRGVGYFFRFYIL